ncbi:LysR family transcriptional regulator [Pseudonocardia sp. TRM90224]|uniref:LysR family transcriptional regulator n=1 Tax=Pseudonocardia sp. TRM90224 TaxID=2812678 RepID=UPI001E41221B|nr:LysR family transcriptional regulator [Pseudonocardia sp. TRM90224]
MSDPGFTLVQLRYFAAAAERGSMTLAARDLMVSQSAVSTAVALLEKELGVQLLLRHHARGLTLTPAGRAFHQQVREFLAHSVELVESARQAGTEVVGNLTLGCFITLAPFRLPRLLAEFEKRHPAVRAAVREGEHAALKTALRAGDCEIALLYGYDLDDDIEHTVLDATRPYALVPAGHRFAERPDREVALAELADEPMILLDLPHSADYLLGVLRAAGVEPVIRHRSAGFETVRALVANGHGYAVLNQRPAHDGTYGGGRAVPLTLRDEVPPLNIVLCWMRGTRPTRRAQAFLHTCRALYSEGQRSEGR